MLNVLIVEDKPKYISFLVNNIIAKINSLRIVGVCCNAEVAINLMNFKSIDIIISNHKLFCDILNRLPEENKKYYNNSFIVISRRNTPSLNSEDCIISSIILEDKNTEKNMLDAINTLIIHKSYDFKRDTIIYELKKIGYNLNHKGSQYLIEVILEIYINKNRFQGNLKKEIYPIISKRFNTSTHNIHCDITRATENMVYFCNDEILDKYFKGIRPTTKTVINIVIRRIA